MILHPRKPAEKTQTGRTGKAGGWVKLKEQHPGVSLTTGKDPLDAKEQGPASGLMTFDQPCLEIRFIRMCQTNWKQISQV